ncbi:ChaN family lipoprotein [Aquincola sp. S2]|uniref:ChaN family lipoprotein n=1 Tax=Pseudaquabacterium terrae TaxID=2732868 RepID=A0ABX2ECH6_9BURK|nr:ChaN family lipoprotein [Aquabacterium terrae]NRF65530.1 ChaN family lipoprotein [Aquabacterium terrae]
MIRRGALATLWSWAAGCAIAPPADLDLRGAPPLLLLGEVHDNAAQHALRARALAALLTNGARPALLMEQFDREQQAALDAAAAAPHATPATLISAAGRGGWHWPHYEPVLALALAHALPIVAANVSRSDARRIIAEGLSAHGFDAAVPEDLMALQVAAIVRGHCGHLDAAGARRLAPAQIARDQFMARQLTVHAARGAVLLAGNGHVRSDAGVPRWLAPAQRERSLAIGLLEHGDETAGRFDRALHTPPQPRPDPCAAMAPATR